MRYEHYDQIRCLVTRSVIIIIIIIIVYNGRESFVRYHGRIVGVLCARESTYTAGVRNARRRHRCRIPSARACLFYSLRRCPYLDKLAPKLYAHTFYIIHNMSAGPRRNNVHAGVALPCPIPINRFLL